MFSYVFMKILELHPRSYDRGMQAASGGATLAIKRDIAAAVRAGQQVLEIGCGAGELAMLMIARGAQVEGFDQNPGMVEAALARAEREGQAQSFSARTMGVDGMDGLPAEHYDAVVSILVFSELSDDGLRFALTQARRALKPGGLLVVGDEVVPRGAGQRMLHDLARTPLLALTYLTTGTSTRPVQDLGGQIRAAGLVVDDEQRRHGDSFAIVRAHRPAAQGEARP